jgi:hypothetical protein
MCSSCTQNRVGEEIRRGDSLLGIGLGALQGVGVTTANGKNGSNVQEVMILLWKLLDINKVRRLPYALNVL